MYRILILAFISLIPVHAACQVKFIEVTSAAEMKAARDKAAAGDLLLFVDVYADWCGPCKMMDRDVYTDPEVAEYMNAHFVNVRMDGETDYGRKYSNRVKLQGFPSMFIFDPGGDPVSTLVGFRAPGELVASLKGALDNYGRVNDFRTAYEKGSLCGEAFASYIEAVRELGNNEEAERLAGEYIRDQVSGELSDNDIRVVAYYTDLEDSWWMLFTSEQERISRVLEDQYVPAMEQIYHNTLAKAVNQKNIKLVSRMANELSPLLESAIPGYWDLRTLPFIQYYYYTGQERELVRYVDSRFASDRTGDHSWLFGAASQIIDMDQQKRSPFLMRKGEIWLSTCIEMEARFDYYFYHGMVMVFQNRRNEARDSFNRASSLASTDEERSMVNQVLRYVN